MSKTSITADQLIAGSTKAFNKRRFVAFLLTYCIHLLGLPQKKRDCIGSKWPIPLKLILTPKLLSD